MTGCLYVRDAFAMEPDGPDVPPPLEGVVEPEQLTHNAKDKYDLSVAWLRWWRRVTHVLGTLELSDEIVNMSPDARIHSMLAANHSVLDYDEGFASLHDSPLLQLAPQRGWESSRAQPRRYGPDRFHRANSVYKDAAEWTIERFGVLPEFVKAAVFVLPVTGLWAHISEPGLLLCSEELYFEDSLFESELKRAFESGLQREEP